MFEPQTQDQICFQVVSHHLPEPLGGPAVSRKRPQLEIFRTCLVFLGRDRQGKRMEIPGEYIFWETDSLMRFDGIFNSSSKRERCC